MAHKFNIDAVQDKTSAVEGKRKNIQRLHKVGHILGENNAFGNQKRIINSFLGGIFSVLGKSSGQYYAKRTECRRTITCI